MTPVREKKMKRFFNIYDANSSGTIQKGDFEKPVQAGAAFLGLAPDSNEYSEMYEWSMGFWEFLCQNLNKNDNDLITTSEFLNAMDALATDKTSLNKIIMGHANFTLKLWDRDNDGMMSQEEFIAAHTAYNVNPDSAHEAFGHLDRNGDSQLSYEEIIQAIDEYFTSDDPEAIGNWFILDN
ncbi:MAG: hypothetical protein AAF490_11990 [Chloroflexota bacterium]